MFHGQAHATPAVISTLASATNSGDPSGPTSANASDVCDSKSTLSTDCFPGDVGAQISAADKALGSNPGLINVTTAGILSTPATLSPKHNLSISAPLTQTATLTVLGSNVISCEGHGSIASSLGDAVNMIAATSASDIIVKNCQVKQTHDSTFVSGTGISGLTLDHNTLSGGKLLQLRPGPTTNSHIIIDHNSVISPNDVTDAAIVLINTQKLEMSDNYCEGEINCVEWWGGDSGAAGMTPSNVTLTGDMVFTGNRCKNMVQTCIWGSMGFGITLSGNSADGCGDYCFGTEGGLRTKFIANSAKHYANGGIAMEFFSKDTSITGGELNGPGAAILIKNVSQLPVRHQGVDISGVTMISAAIALAMLQEASSDVHFHDNLITNGTYQAVSFAGNTSIRHNKFRFTVRSPTAFTAIAAPGVIGNSTLEVIGNEIQSVVPQPPGSTAINATWADFNTPDTMVITDNRSMGGFTTDILTVNKGGNPGIFATWLVQRNLAPATTHKAQANEHYTMSPGTK